MPKAEETKELVFYVKEDLYESVRKLAFVRHQSMSKTLGQIIENYLKSLSKD